LIDQIGAQERCRFRRSGLEARMATTENRIRAMIAAVLAMTISVAIADDIDDARQQALAGLPVIGGIAARKEWPR
jgi:hypothetical protein